MRAICDTHVLLFWADQPQHLSASASAALSKGLAAGGLACADISLWEIAMLYVRGHINNQAGITAEEYIRDILAAMDMAVLPITAEIATLAQGDLFPHGDPADRLIGATALSHGMPLITADEHLRAVPALRCIW